MRAATSACFRIKASQTLAAPLFKNLRTVSALLGGRVMSQHLVHGGADRQVRTEVQVMPFWDAGQLIKNLSEA